MVRVGVVGHVEWVEFARLDGVLSSGDILRTPGLYAEAAGGGGMAAAELARLAGSCVLQTAVGHDAIGRGIAASLAPLSIDVRSAVRPEPHRRALTLIGADGERTIVVIGPAQQPLGSEFQGMRELDGVYFCKGDVDAAKHARAARVLVATARVLTTLQAARVRLDALVLSAADPSETYEPGDLNPAPGLVVTTRGARGGCWVGADGRRGRWTAAPLPGKLEDTYGAGDCFAAGLTFGLARGLGPDEAVALGAQSAARAITRRGAHGGRLQNL